MILIVDNNKKNTNHLNNNKYSLIYIPINTIFKYFSNLENIYFLVIAIFQLLTLGILPKHWSPTGPYSTVIPLFLCLLLEIISDINLWIKTYISCYKTNRSKYNIYSFRDKKWITKEYKDLNAGDIIKLGKSIIPVDMLVINSDNKQYTKISLSNLNGESNIVSKVNILHSKDTLDTYFNSKIYITYNDKNNIDNITGYIEFVDNNVCDFDSRNFLVNGSELISDSVIGIVLCVGSEKKLQNIDTHTIYKENTSDKTISNFMMSVTIYLLITLVFIVSIYKIDYTKSIIYIVLSLLLNIIQSWIVLNGIIPFSLKILLSYIRNRQSKFLYQKTGIETNKSYLIDQFPNIDYILSDKTGTITKNCLEVINLIDRELDIYDLGVEKTKIDYNIIRGLGLSISYDSGDFHTIEDKSIHSKYIYLDSIIDYDCNNITLKIYDVIEHYIHIDTPFLRFSVSRPISSNLYKIGDKYVLYTKASIPKFCEITNDIDLVMNADVKISNLDPSLRLLALGYKTLDKETVEKLLISKNPEICEVDLKFICIIGIRDNLITNVDKTIYKLQKINKSIGLLTGDRKITAIAIAKQCGIINNNTIIIEHMSDYIIDNNNNNNKYVLLVSNNSLCRLVENSEALKMVLDFISKTKSNIVGYSLTPSSKKMVVDLLESISLRTLAIGDGFNDIPMLMTANIGISLSDKISNSSDFNMSSILELSKLFKYGNEFNYRNSVISIFTLYKSVSLAFVVFCYLLSNHNGEPLFDFFIYQGFHLAWSIIHPIKYSTNIIKPNYYNIKHLLDKKYLTMWIMLSFILSSYLFNNYYSDNKYLLIYLVILQVNLSLLALDFNIISVIYQFINVCVYMLYLFLIGKNIVYRLYSDYLLILLINYSIIGLFYEYKKIYNNKDICY